MGSYSHWEESLYLAFEAADLLDTYNTIEAEKIKDIAASLESSADMQRELASYGRPSASDLMERRVEEIRGSHRKQAQDREESHNREIESARITIRGLENCIYNLRRDLERALQ